MSTHTQHRNDFVPVLLGTEIGDYGMARAFYEEFGVSSVAYGTFPLTPTANSRFIEVRIDPDFGKLDRFVEVLNRDAHSFGTKIPIIVSCGDDYTRLLAHASERLDPVYRFACPPADLVDTVLNKTTFYELCERHKVPYPGTVVLDDVHVGELPFDFPVALKPDDAPAYREHPFEGQKKAYVVDTRDRLEQTVRRIYAAGYPGKLIVQEFIPGADDNMRVVNGYVRNDGTVSLIALGHPLLEMYSPSAIGNYAAILTYGDDAVYDMVERFVTSLEGRYRGFFNIDMKYDPRDGVYKLFELNPRPGRSSFYATLAGYNLARFIVDDVVDGGSLAPVRAINETLWLGVPRWIVRRYARNSPDKDHALALMHEGRTGTTLFSANDRNMRRMFNIGKIWLRYGLDYLQYFGDRA